MQLFRRMQRLFWLGRMLVCFCGSRTLCCCSYLVTDCVKMVLDGQWAESHRPKHKTNFPLRNGTFLKKRTRKQQRRKEPKKRNKMLKDIWFCPQTQSTRLPQTNNNTSTLHIDRSAEIEQDRGVKERPFILNFTLGNQKKSKGAKYSVKGWCGATIMFWKPAHFPRAVSVFSWWVKC